MLAEMNDTEKAYALLILGIGAVFVIVISAWIIHAMTMSFRRKMKNTREETPADHTSAWKESANRIDTSEIPEDPEDIINQ